MTLLIKIIYKDNIILIETSHRFCGYINDSVEKVTFQRFFALENHYIDGILSYIHNI